jgi:DNA-binding MarR family transcriptional regulator
MVLRAAAQRGPDTEALRMARAAAKSKIASVGTEEARPTAQLFRFGYLIHDVSRTRRTLFDLLMKPMGITRSQWSVLAWLSRDNNSGTSQVDLARILDVGKVSIGGLIDRLEESGHVERRFDKSDRRVRRIFITTAGYETIRVMQTFGQENNLRIMRGVTAEELRITEETLAKVKENIRQELDARSAADGRR